MLKQTLILATFLTAGGALAQNSTPPATPAPSTTAPATPTKQPAAKAAATLAIGDTAPAIEFEKFLKGAPVTGFEKGKVYVVEFWATWCGPCIASMPHLSKIQKQYADKVTLIGVNAFERNITAETLTKVEKFVEKQGDRMAYTVAYDGAAAKTTASYMIAAKQQSIPACFVVDQNGKIAWLGHPSMLDAVLADVTSGKWDIKTSPAKLDEARTKLNAIVTKSRSDHKGALADWTAFEKDYPAYAAASADTKLNLLIGASEWPEAYKILRAMTDEAIAGKDAMKLNDVAWTLVDPGAKVEKPDLELAMKAATKAAEFTNNEDGAILDTLARVHFVKGEIDKAIEIQTKAVGLVTGRMKDELQKNLDEFKAAKNK